MSSILVRSLNPKDKSWLRQEAERQSISMEELMRRLVREKREKTECRMLPSEAFRKYFGPENGIDLPPRRRYGYHPIDFSEKLDS